MELADEVVLDRGWRGTDPRGIWCSNGSESFLGLSEASKRSELLLRPDPRIGCPGWKLVLPLRDGGTLEDVVVRVVLTGCCCGSLGSVVVGELGDDGVERPDEGSLVTGGLCRTTSSNVGCFLSSETFLVAGGGGLSSFTRSLTLLPSLSLYDSAFSEGGC